ncbi:MAG: hypothetical protein RL490_2198 [Pseudomonadota bacterium]|jgi:uncharacterized membrane protein
MSQRPDVDPVPRPPQRGGGVLIAAGLLLGPIVGIMIGETSAGLIGGLILGVIAAVVMAIRDKR